MTLTAKTSTTTPKTADALKGRGSLPRVALVGCGAIAEKYHLPALAKYRAMLGGLVLVDRELDRAAKLAASYDIGECFDSLDEVADKIDAAIVAAPPALHHPICTDLLTRGVHVLCEKPLAETARDAREMVEHAETCGRTLCVNQTRRFFPAYQKVREMIAGGEIGELLSITYCDGNPFSWKAVSAFHFCGTPRGVLLDKGIHALDALCWWVGATPCVISSENDSFGGPEATAHICAKHQNCSIDLRLSWLAPLENRFVVVGDKATITGGIEQWDRIRIRYRNGRVQNWKCKCPETNYNDFGARALGNFLDVVAGADLPRASGSDVLPAMDVLEECYKKATQFSLPWVQPFETLHVE